VRLVSGFGYTFSQKVFFGYTFSQKVFFGYTFSQKVCFGYTFSQKVFFGYTFSQKVCYFCNGIVLIMLLFFGHETSFALNLKQLEALSLYVILSTFSGVG
jgi:hypothetical protein